MPENILKTSVSLGEKDRQIVNQVRSAKGLNFSATLRMIIREWYADRYHITERGRQALEDERELERIG